MAKDKIAPPIADLRQGNRLGLGSLASFLNGTIRVGCQGWGKSGFYSVISLPNFQLELLAGREAVRQDVNIVADLHVHQRA